MRFSGLNEVVIAERNESQAISISNCRECYEYRSPTVLPMLKFAPVGWNLPGGLANSARYRIQNVDILEIILMPTVNHTCAVL